MTLTEACEPPDQSIRDIASRAVKEVRMRFKAEDRQRDPQGFAYSVALVAANEAYRDGYREGAYDYGDQ